MDCSIVIVNYNTSQLIRELLRSVNRFCKRYSYEIIIVDNASPNDDLSGMKAEFPQAKIIEHPQNDGFGIANNIGIRHAKGDHILLLNSDTLLIDDALDKCLDFMMSDFCQENNIGLMACQLLNRDSTHQPSTFAHFKLHKYFIQTNALLRRLQKSNNEREIESGFVAAVSGAFMLFKKEVFEVVRPFDPDIFMYSEETELCRERVGKHFNIYYWVGASIIHFGGASSNNKMQLQEQVSYSLVWYKKGISLYLIHLIIVIFNEITGILMMPFMKAANRVSTFGQIRHFPKLLYYMIFKIPAYPKGWGARPSPLKVK